MKIVAQSTTSTKMPYLHLAYLAATTRIPHGGLFSISLAMVIAAVVMTFKLSRGDSKRGFANHSIKIKKASSRKRVFRLLLVALTGVVLSLSFYFGTNHYPHRKTLAMTNLFQIKRELVKYASDNEGKLPGYSNWCDELFLSSQENSMLFRHPDIKVRESSVNTGKVSYYAMNINLDSIGKLEDLPPDMVVIFETKEGWNQAGGAELVCTEYVDESGCNVLFGDNGVKFVKTEDMPGLKWEIDN